MKLKFRASDKNQPTALNVLLRSKIFQYHNFLISSVIKTFGQISRQYAGLLLLELQHYQIQHNKED